MNTQKAPEFAQFFFFFFFSSLNLPLPDVILHAYSF